MHFQQPFIRSAQPLGRPLKHSINRCIETGGRLRGLRGWVVGTIVGNSFLMTHDQTIYGSVQATCSSWRNDLYLRRLSLGEQAIDRGIEAFDGAVKCGCSGITNSIRHD
ncbi:hypothetical protein JQ604_12120 [Bradyrhizobium jicamae]|uniref:hypothetical protein n=1 Tax=Bradyrhizobium jicamae TaxID=280332 RepID=UPI001BA6CC06|nr:hypothetical protein [Bradyrhizobium jicamae]MBR0752932.1 hypothetical protein [Bradyrhizobium jicamae]